MSKVAIKLPSPINEEVQTEVYRMADERNYLSMNRVQAGSFIDSLVAEKKVGYVVAQHCPKERVRTYIKDGILNSYSKQRHSKATDISIENIVSKRFSGKFESCDECDYIQLLRGVKEDSNKFVVVTKGTYVKWETALRRALLYVESKPFSENTSYNIATLLLLSSGGKELPHSDRKQLSNALARVHVSVEII